MTLSELCEPVFTRVSLLYRSLRVGVRVGSVMEERQAFKRLLETELTRRAQDHSAQLWRQYEQVRLPLTFFVDGIIAGNRSLPYSDEWNRNRLAADSRELTGDEKFYDLLDETLADTSPEAIDRIEIFYTCLALGFVGSLAPEGEELRRYIMTCSHRLHDARRLALSGDGTLSPEAYKHTLRRPLQLPRRAIGAIIVALLVSLVVVLIGNIFLFRLASVELRQAIEAQILDRVRQQPVAETASAASAGEEVPNAAAR